MISLRRVLVTGAASGIGQAAAELLRERGDEVLGVDKQGSDVDADLSTPEGRSHAVAVARERWDALDAVLACAGLSDPSTLTVRVNFFGVTELLTGLRPLLAESSAPRAAVVGSVSGTHPIDDGLVQACLDGDEQEAARLAGTIAEGDRAHKIYSSSKAALARWVRRTCVRPGWADAGIPLNAVAPGTVRTPLSDFVFSDPELRELMDKFVPMPLNGYADPEVIARCLLWLISEDNTHVTGQIIYPDGGAEATTRGDAQWLGAQW